MEAPRQRAFTQPTIIMKDFDGTPMENNGGGQPTAEDAVMRLVMQHLGCKTPPPPAG